jgi:hypothetical protein
MGLQQGGCCYLWSKSQHSGQDQVHCCTAAAAAAAHHTPTLLLCVCRCIANSHQVCLDTFQLPVQFLEKCQHQHQSFACNVRRGLRLLQRKLLEAANTAGGSNTVTNKSNIVTNSEDPEEVEFQVDQLHLALIKGVCGPPPPQVGLPNVSVKDNSMSPHVICTCCAACMISLACRGCQPG